MEIFDRLTEPRMPLAREKRVFSDSALRAMAIPLIIEQVLQTVVGLADTMMVSYAGEAVVAGVGLDNLVNSIFICLFNAISAGGSVVVSQYIGKHDRRSADESASQIFHISGLVSLVCMAFMLICGGWLMGVMYPTTEPATMEACRTYLTIVALSYPAISVYSAGAALYRTMGQTRVTMWVSLSANLINVVGNAIGIFALHAGAAGVAWPTVISWYAAAFIMTGLCLKDGNRVRIYPKQVFILNLPMTKRILNVAVPNAIENTLFMVAKVVQGMLVAEFGTSQIAANTVGQTFWNMAACVGGCMGVVFITAVGQCMGAGDTEAAEWYIRKITRLSLMLAIIWNVLVTAAAPILLQFYDLTAETRSLVIIIVCIHDLFSALVQPFSGPMSSGLRAAGDVKFTMWASLFSTVVCRTVLSFILCKWLGTGVIGIALAMVLDWCIKATLDIVRFRSRKWLGHRVID